MYARFLDTPRVASLIAPVPERCGICGPRGVRGGEWVLTAAMGLSLFLGLLLTQLGIISKTPNYAREEVF